MINRVLQDIEACPSDLVTFFSDAQRREIAFTDLKRAAGESLWQSCATLTDYHRQLAVLLQQTLHKLPCALDLTDSHLSAFGHLLKCLSKPSITEQDIAKCTDELESCGAPLFPGLGERTDELMELYDEAEEE